jgi:hypothetical protein
MRWEIVFMSVHVVYYRMVAIMILVDEKLQGDYEKILR